MSNLFEDVVAFILNKPGYMKWGKEKLAEKLEVSEEEVQKAKDYVNQYYYYHPLKREFYEKREDIPSPEASIMENENKNENKIREEEFSYADMSLEEYCEWVGLDYDLIDPHKDVKYWTDSSGRRRYTVVPRVDTRGVTKAKFINDIREALEGTNVNITSSYSFDYEEADVLGIINPTDAHIDKLCYTSGNRTIRSNIEEYKLAILTQASQLKAAGCAEIYLVLGSDLWDTNDANSTTKRGTPQELNTHYRKSYRAGITANVEIVKEITGMNLKVNLVIIEGNHDEDKVFHLGVALELLFEDSPITVFYNDVRPRQYIKFGTNLIGFGHGYHEKKIVSELPLHMAEEAKEYWSTTTNRIFFLGDTHQNREYSFMRSREYKGVQVRFLRDIAMGDSQWDIHKGYHTYPRSTEAFLFHRDKGQIASFIFNL